MSRRERIRIAHGRYLVVDQFRRDEVLVPRVDHAHSEADLRLLALNRARYESQVLYAAKRWCVVICMHCWLPNRALLELQLAHAPLESFMHSLRQPYSHFLRRSASMSGQTYAQRYTAWLVDPQSTADLRRHIFWQPVRAGLCRNPLEYPYITTNCNCSVCARSPLVDWLAKHRLTSRAQLAQFVFSPPGDEFLGICRGSVRDRRIIGTPKFVARARRAHPHPSPPLLAHQVIPWVADLVGISARDLADDAHDPVSWRARALIGWLVSCSGTGSVTDVATWFKNCDRSRLQRLIDHSIQMHAQLFAKPTLDEFVRFITSARRQSGLALQAPLAVEVN